MYIHCYPVEDAMPDVLVTTRLRSEHKGGVDHGLFYRAILPLGRMWAASINHIRWSDRLAFDNHHPFFPRFHTVIWDTTCFRVQQSREWFYARATVNGHYDFPSYLVLIGITFTGEIVFASGLFRNTGYDGNFYMDTYHLHAQHPWERNIGDGHFATCPRFDTPAQKINGRQLTPLELVWNNWLQLPRSRIEHLNRVVKAHAMFNGAPFRGWVENLAVFVKITCHVSAVEIRKRRQLRGPRYAPYGWWRHG